MKLPLGRDISWGIPEPIQTKSVALRWVCGFCDHRTASDRVYYPKVDGADRGIYKDYSIRICQACQRPSWFESGRQYPPERVGDDINHLPEDLDQLYGEMRDAAGVGAYTASVLTARKILMHVAVEKGAKENQRFITYVEYLLDKGYAPTGSGDWVDYIRKRANEANHDIVLMDVEDAAALAIFTEQLLRNVYALPATAATVKSIAEGKATPGRNDGSADRAAQSES